MSTDTTLPEELPAEARGWNWGAFLLSWIWGLGNRTPIALLALIPVVNFIMMIILGIKGNTWAWRNDSWKSVAHFRRTQRHWAIAGFIVWGLLILVSVGTVVMIVSLMTNNRAYDLSMERLRASPQIIEVFGEPLEDGFMPSGSINVSGGSGRANFEIGIHGPRAAGTGYSKLVREAGIWRLTYLAARVEGSEEVIVVVPQD